MGKISPVSAKYIIHASIHIDGVVDRPDVIGAVFGQTEGLLGADLELRELQRSGKIGRIEVNLDVRSGKTDGDIVVPSSLDKAETSIVGAALEIIQRIGPCNAKIEVKKIEDVRISKREFVIDRAKQLLKRMMENVMPDSQELADEVAYSVRVMEIQEYGRERLPAGPAIDESDEIILVEGRADVLNLLKHGFKNAIAMNGTSVPPSIVELAQQKIVTVFVDGDRGGNLILQELFSVAEVDFVTKAPDGKEVEELTKKEIHKALRAKIAAEQAKLDLGIKAEGQKSNNHNRPDNRSRPQQNNQRRPAPQQQAPPRPAAKQRTLNEDELQKISELLEDLIGTRGAYILDDKLAILGKVPVSELQGTLKSLTSGIFAVALDGTVDKDLLIAAERANVGYLIGMDVKVKATGRTKVLNADEL